MKKIDKKRNKKIVTDNYKNRNINSSRKVQNEKRNDDTNAVDIYNYRKKSNAKQTSSKMNVKQTSTKLNNVKKTNKKSKRINKKKLILVFVVLFLFVFAVFKISASVIDSIAKQREISQNLGDTNKETKTNSDSTDKDSTENDSKNSTDNALTTKDTSKEEKKADDVEKSISNGKKYIVLIDAGHGGNDKGTISKTTNQVFEKDLTLKIANKVQKYLTNYKDISVLMTRTDDSYLSLDDRVNIANKQNPDILVSVHINSEQNNTNAEGIETWYRRPTSDKGDKSKELATTIQETIISYVGAKDRGILENNFE
ncbi:MAG: N-acetylmuramoyl-L-alanine amidase, partial [Clostridioides sp.]|nr:N-acetylmuramoyl-L-alanine amidase [Clostridioides sp.]